MRPRLGRGECEGAKPIFMSQALDAAKASLSTLEGLLSEGLITEAEYRQRRKLVLDKVTEIPSAGGGGSETSTGRTGNKPAQGAWGHDGYEALYGGAGSSSKKGVATPNDLRAKLSRGTTDLRSKLSGDIIKPMPTGRGDQEAQPEGRPAQQAGGPGEEPAPAIARRQGQGRRPEGGGKVSMVARC